MRDDFATRLIQRQLLGPVAALGPRARTRSPTNMPRCCSSRAAASSARCRRRRWAPGAEPSEAELAAFYRSNQARYTIPERRVLRYAVFGPEHVAAAVAGDRGRDPGRLSPRTRAYAAARDPPAVAGRASDEAAARALAQKVAAGTSFAAAAAAGRAAAPPTSRSAPTAARHFAAKSSPAVAAAAFGAAKGATVGPIRVAVRLARRQGRRRHRLAATAARGGARRDRRPDPAAQGAERASTTSPPGSRMRSATARASTRSSPPQKLAVKETAPVTATGAAPDNPGWQAPPELQPLLEGAFAIEPGEDPAVETIQENQRYALVAVTRVDPGRGAAARPDPRPGEGRPDRPPGAPSGRGRWRPRSSPGSMPARRRRRPSPRRRSSCRAVQTLTATRREIARPNAAGAAADGDDVQPAPRQGAAPPGARRARLVRRLSRQDRPRRREQGARPRSRRCAASSAQIIGEEYARQFTAAIRAELKVERNDEAVRKLRTELAGPGAAPVTGGGSEAGADDPRPRQL